MDKPFSFIFNSTTDSFLSSMSFFLPSTNADRNSFASLFNLAILWTFLSALCELAIITNASDEIKRIILQFLNASSLTKKVPFKICDTLFLIYNFSATLSFALLALLFILISSLFGTINPPTFFKGTSKCPNTSLSGSPSNKPFLIKRFTNLSSKE